MKNIDIEKQQNMTYYNNSINKRIKYLNNRKVINTTTKEESSFTVNDSNSNSKIIN